MSDVSFTAVELALITGLLGGLTAPLAILFHTLRGSYLDRVADLREQIVESRRRNDELRPAIERMSEVIREQTSVLKLLLDREDSRRRD